MAILGLNRDTAQRLERKRDTVVLQESETRMDVIGFRADGSVIIESADLRHVLRETGVFYVTLRCVPYIVRRDTNAHA